MRKTYMFTALTSLLVAALAAAQSPFDSTWKNTTIAASPLVGESATLSFSQGPCTEDAVKQGNLPMADDAFSYMPAFGKPVTGKASIQSTGEKKFAARTNRKFSWEADHRIVASPSGDMAYEHGTMDVSYEEDGKPHQFKAVMLNVYKAKGDICERVAGTMQPLEEDSN